MGPRQCLDVRELVALPNRLRIERFFRFAPLLCAYGEHIVPSFRRMAATQVPLTSQHVVTVYPRTGGVGVVLPRNGGCRQCAGLTEKRGRVAATLAECSLAITKREHGARTAD